MLTILQGDVIEQLRTLPDESVHCCVTSPPYWGLRDYGTAQWEGGSDDCDHVQSFRPQRDHNGKDFGDTRGLEDARVSTKIPFRDVCGKCGAKRIDSQLGLEKTPEEYVAKMVQVFREVRRVLRKDGTLWMNMGDAYNSPNTHTGKADKVDWGLQRVLDAKANAWIGNKNLKPKDLLGMPWRVAFALQADGWWLRSDIIWSKPNPMPESVTDRPTKAHEYLFLLTKSANYFYDAEAIREPHVEPWRGNGEIESQCPKDSQAPGLSKASQVWGVRQYNPSGRNKRSVWTVATAPYPEAHFATYPPDLIKPCILAGTSAKGCCAKCWSPWERVVEKESFCAVERGNVPSSFRAFGQPQQAGVGCNSKTIGWQPTCKCEAATTPCTVIDPFAGSFTTCAVALELGRRSIGIELNPKYVELGKQRCNITPGLQLA